MHISTQSMFSSVWYSSVLKIGACSSASVFIARDKIEKKNNRRLYEVSWYRFSLWVPVLTMLITFMLGYDFLSPLYWEISFEMILNWWHCLTFGTFIFHSRLNIYICMIGFGLNHVYLKNHWRHLVSEWLYVAVKLLLYILFHNYKTDIFGDSLTLRLVYRWTNGSIVKLTQLILTDNLIWSIHIFF